MVIYIDVLIFTNILIDYLLISATALIVKRNFSIIRVIIASLLGGLSSLYILVETKSALIDFAYSVLVSLILVLVSSGYKKGFLISVATLFGLSFALNGAVAFISNYFDFGVIFSDNLISYYNVSPLLLISVTAVFYLVLKTIQRILDRRLKPKSVELTVEILGSEYSFNALVDSGNLVKDPFGNAQVFIVDGKEFERIIELIPEAKLQRRERVIPVKTINETKLLNAVRCDGCKIITSENVYEYTSPIIAASEKKLANGFNAIVSSVSLDAIPNK